MKRIKISNIINFCKDVLLITVGILCAGFGLKGFLIPNGFIDGGVTGISLLVAALTPISISLLIFMINIPFMILGLKQIGKTFFFRTFLGIAGLALGVAIIPYPVITHDSLLIAVFGGFFLGAGIGLAVRGGGVIDGTEILAIYLSKKMRTSMGTILFVVNIVIFSVAAIFLGIESALYSIVIYLAASKTVDFVVRGIEEYIGLTIISDKSEEIRKSIIKNLGKGVTIYRGKGGYETEKEMDILFTVVTRLEISKVFRKIREIDPAAFIIEESLNEVSGGMIKKRRSH